MFVGSGDMYSTAYQDGAFRFSLIEGWLTGIGEKPFIQTMVDAEGSLAFHAQRDNAPFIPNVTWPSIHMVGWWDIFGTWGLAQHEAYQHRGGPGGAGNAYLIVVPGGHCLRSTVDWPGAAEGIQAADALASALSEAISPGLGDTDAEASVLETDADAPHVAYYVMGNGVAGSPGNYWTTAATFPRVNATRFFLTPGSGRLAGGLSLQPSSNANANVSYVYDPTDPAPTIGGANLVLPQCGPWDQSSLESRPDVALFTTSPAAQDTYLAGAITVTLTVASTANDTDFAVRMTDVFPNGTSLLMQDGITRMRWRDGIQNGPKLITPGQPYQVQVSLWNTSYVVAAGHSVRLIVVYIFFNFFLSLDFFFSFSCSICHGKGGLFLIYFSVVYILLFKIFMNNFRIIIVFVGFVFVFVFVFVVILFLVAFYFYF